MLNLFSSYFIYSGISSNISYNWNFGSVLGVILVLQIIIGVLLGMYYTANIELSFNIVEYIIRDIEYGWLIRYLYTNGASLFFLFVYLHIGRNLYVDLYIYSYYKLWENFKILLNKLGEDLKSLLNKLGEDLKSLLNKLWINIFFYNFFISSKIHIFIFTILFSIIFIYFNLYYNIIWIIFILSFYIFILMIINLVLLHLKENELTIFNSKFEIFLSFLFINSLIVWYLSILLLPIWNNIFLFINIKYIYIFLFSFFYIINLELYSFIFNRYISFKIYIFPFLFFNLLDTIIYFNFNIRKLNSFYAVDLKLEDIYFLLWPFAFLYSSASLYLFTEPNIALFNIPMDYNKILLFRLFMVLSPHLFHLIIDNVYDYGSFNNYNLISLFLFTSFFFLRDHTVFLPEYNNFLIEMAELEEQRIQDIILQRENERALLLERAKEMVLEDVRYQLSLIHNRPRFIMK